MLRQLHHRYFGKSWGSKNKGVRGKAKQPALQVETLENRLVPAVFNVNSLADMLNPPAGAVTLRSAIRPPMPRLVVTPSTSRWPALTRSPCPAQEKMPMPRATSISWLRAAT